MIEEKKAVDISEDLTYIPYGLLNYRVLEGMADWVRVIDRNGKVIFANAAMKEALGDDIVGSDCYKVNCRNQKCGFCITSRSIETGETVQKEEIIQGQYYSVKSSPVKNQQGEIAGLNLLGLTQFKRNSNGTVELTFADRMGDVRKRFKRAAPRTYQATRVVLALALVAWLASPWLPRVS